MFDKQKLNNQITANKNSVKRAKILVISKLVKKCRILKQKPENDKINGKVNRIIQQITAIKKFNCIEILKKAILFENDPNKILSNSKSTVTEFAEALIFKTKIIQDIVQHLKTTFNLNDNNPEWKNIFLQSKNARNRISKSVNKKAKYMDNNQMNLEKEDTNKSEYDTLKVDEKEILKKVSTERKNSKISLTKQKNENLNKNNKEKFIMKPDSFFKTSSGQDYMSTVHFDANEFDVENQKSSKAKDHLTKTNRSNNFFRNSDQFERQNETKKIKIDSAEYENKNKLKNNSDKKIDNAVHPSWQAKQKLKPIIQEFKGKKIVFGD